MISIVKGEEVETELVYEGTRVTHFINRGDVYARGPQVFMVDNDPHWVNQAHYHTIDQFIIAVRGEAIGKTPIDGAAVVSYTDAFTPYGPLLGDDEGLTFFNFRNRADMGVQYMPEARKNMPIHPGRHLIGRAEVVDPAQAAGVQQTTLVGPEPDGVLCLDTVAGPGERLPDEVAGRNSRYGLVLEGSITIDGAEYGPKTILTAHAGCQMPDREAGQEGARLLSLQFPVE